MIAELQKRLRKPWHLFRRHFKIEPPAKPLRLAVEKATWPRNAASPVMLMVDDLTNAWHNRSAGDRWEHGGDWGGGLHHSGSVLRFLEESLLRRFPEIKVTFFTVADAISAYTHDQPFSYAAALDANEESRRFFRDLSVDPRFELAYHGFNHGTPGERTEDFKQEWQGFVSREAAVAQTMRGMEIFLKATGVLPLGGKYGGWDYNGFADEVVDHCGFLWWCRDWMPRDVAGGAADAYYEPQFFGDKLVVALPSTIHGYFWDRRQIDMLLKRRQVISIEEHIAPVRPDGLVQTPNIIDDEKELTALFQYLRGKDVWYATGSEIASYVIARERSIVYDVTREGFSIRYEGRASLPMLTLKIDCSAVCTPEQPMIEVSTPDGKQVEYCNFRYDPKRYQHQVTVPVMEGRYSVRPMPCKQD